MSTAADILLAGITRMEDVPAARSSFSRRLPIPSVCQKRKGKYGYATDRNQGCKDP